MLYLLSMVTTETHQRLFKAAESSDINLDELIAAVADLLPHIAPDQTRYKVTEVPDNRTIRYYISQNLLPKPLSYAGGRANYGGVHVLTLLFIKKQQARYFSLRQIKQQLDTLATQYQHNTQEYQRHLIELLLEGMAAESGMRQPAFENEAAPTIAEFSKPSNKVLPPRLQAGNKGSAVEPQSHPITASNIVEYGINTQCTVYVSATALTQPASIREIAQALRQLADQLQDSSND